ncbi:hypothetical protein BGX38DRAFT_1195955, partial [Terfezia claveryi]
TPVSKSKCIHIHHLPSPFTPNLILPPSTRLPINYSSPTQPSHFTALPHSPTTSQNPD